MRCSALLGFFLLGGCAADLDPAPGVAVPEIAAVTTARPFYAIAHMTNTPRAARWAVDEGANGVEIDIRFAEDGTPDTVRHGGGVVCDCLCSFGGARHVCSVLDGDCEASSPVSTMLATLATLPLALVILDSKLTGDDASERQQAAGERIVAATETELFDRGFAGHVIISAAKTDALPYLASAARAAQRSPYAGRITFALDQMGKTATAATCTLGVLGGLASSSRAFGTGVSACAPGDYGDAITTASAGEEAGVSSFTYVWTLDKEASMRRYIGLGARGILTNKPSKLVEVARELGLTLAAPGTRLGAVTRDAPACE